MKNIFLTGLSLTVAGVGATQAQSPAKRPNILYIMSDDHAYQAVSAYGYGLNQTPNIDRIGREGMRFNNCFVTNSLSGPSRAVMLTGKFSHKNGFYDNAAETVFDGSQQTLPKLLQAAGYHTGIVGKWHLKSTPTGFDHYSVHYGQGQYYNPDFMENGEKRVYYEGYATDLTADNAIKFLKESEGEKPFFLMMQFKAPHRNWMPAPDKLSMYEDVTFPMPATFYDTYEGRIAAQQQKMSVEKDMTAGVDLKTYGVWDTVPPHEFRRMTPAQRAAWDKVYNPVIEDFARKLPEGKELAEWKFQRYMRDYLKCVSSVDDNIGRVLDYLQKTGELDNTIIIYTSDQGFYLGEHGWFDKRFMYEESLKTPFVIRYPQAISPNGVTDAMIQNVDFAPTLLDLAGLPVPQDMQGESFKAVLTGKKQTAKEAVYYHYYEYPMPHAVKKHYGVRTDRYKLIHFYDDIDEWELYDLENDPNEMHNLINDPAQAENIRALKKKLSELQVKYEDTDPTGGV
ncbi:MAG: sulfatase [Tannerella sp.]|jgi:arylsulfatase A-like enzyme|nr:sulfatase [Tannerella sp.]